jgi:hypothetical protein
VGHESRWTAFGEKVESEAKYEEATSIWRHREQQVHLDELKCRTNAQEAWVTEHDFHVRKKNAAQGERLRKGYETTDSFDASPTGLLKENQLCY